jgi:3-oxoacyl-[acyl-carrier protein] reductase
MEKVALILGGSGGIGKETARLLSSTFKVCASYNNNLRNLHELGVSLHQIDVTNPDKVNSGISHILQTHGRIDVVIYTVTPEITNKKIKDLDWQEFQKHLDIQVKGLFNVIKSLSPLIEAKHKIKFIAVLTEYCIGNPPHSVSHYVTAKYALMGLMKSMASELVRNNCTFNMVSPGMVDTGLLSNLPPKLVELTAYNNPMKRISTALDVAKVISFLASEHSDYLNGVNIPINGGNVML